MKAWMNQYSLCIHCTVQSCLSADSMATHMSVKKSKSCMGKMYIRRKQHFKKYSLHQFILLFPLKFSVFFTILNIPTAFFINPTVSMYLTVSFLITLHSEHFSLLPGRRIYSLTTQIAWKSPRVLQSDVQGCSGRNSSRKILVGRFLWSISICTWCWSGASLQSPLALDLV